VVGRSAMREPTLVADAAVPPRARAAGAVAAPELALLLAVTAIAVALRAGGLTFQGLEGDEGYSIALAQRSFAEMLALFGYEANGTLYSLLLWPLSRIDDSVAMLRAPAAAAGTLAVPALWWALRPLAGRAAALVAALALAVAPYAVLYSQYARAYGFVVLFAALAVGALVRALADPGRRLWWGAFAAATVLLAYSNALAPIYLGAAELAIVLLLAGPARIGRWLRWLVVAALFCLPLLTALIVERSRRDPLYWLDAPGLRALKDVAARFGAGAWDAPGITDYAPVGAAIAGLALLVVLGRVGRDVLVALAWSALPVLACFALSFLTPLLTPYYVIVALPGLCALLGVLAARLPLMAGVALVLVALAFFAAGTRWQRSHPVLSDLRAATAAWRSEQRPGDTLLVDVIQVLPALGHYDPALRATDGAYVVEEWGDRPLPPRVLGLDDPGGYSDPPAGPPSPALVARHATGGRRLFVLFNEWTSRLQGDALQTAGIGWARAHCRVSERTFNRVDFLVIAGCPRTA